jgi:hypothetical protein
MYKFEKKNANESLPFSDADAGRTIFPFLYLNFRGFFRLFQLSAPIVPLLLRVCYLGLEFKIAYFYIITFKENGRSVKLSTFLGEGTAAAETKTTS